jgi:hypothetical protein
MLQSMLSLFFNIFYLNLTGIENNIQTMKIVIVKGFKDRWHKRQTANSCKRAHGFQNIYLLYNIIRVCACSNKKKYNNTK